MKRTFRYRLHPTRNQARKMEQWLDDLRKLYNAALEQRIEAYRKRGVSLSYYDQCKDLTALRNEEKGYKGISVTVEQQILMRLDKAFKSFFRRLKSGSKPGFPRFRGWGRFSTFSFPMANVKDDRVIIPKIGHVKMKLYRPLQEKIGEALITLRNDRWWVSFSCDLGDAPDKKPVSSAVGVDVGLKSYATLSNGETIENPRFFKKGEALLARRQQALARKKKGSKTREKAKVLVGRAHEHIHNQRTDFSRKLASDLYKRFDLISHEDLNIRGMVISKDGILAKPINDAAWRQFIGSLQSKAEYAGKWCVPVNPRGTTARCSQCGKSTPKALSERIHKCSDCGLSLDRDHNAALNILALGASVAAQSGAEIPSDALVARGQSPKFHKVEI